MQTHPLRPVTVYVVASLYFVTMVAGFVLILRTEFPQIGFDSTVTMIAGAFSASRSTVISSHALLGIGFFLFYPLALSITAAVNQERNGFLNGLLGASLPLRMLPWFGALAIYFLLGSGQVVLSDESSAAVNAILILINTLGEDLAVNLLTGTWALLVCFPLWTSSQSVTRRALAIVGAFLGIIYIISAGDLIGLDLIQAGNPLATLISPMLRVWIIVAAIVLVPRQPTQA